MTTDIALLLAVLLVTVILLVTEVLRVDVVALLVLVSLPWLGLIEPEDAFRGLSSDAVVVIVAVLVIGYGLDHSGITQLLARPIQRLGGGGPRRLLGMTMAATGGVSAFMCNVGTAALFLPVGRRVCKVTGLPPSQLLMPLGFAAILGGCVTMVGSSTVILLNDLVVSCGGEPFGLFAVTPIGLMLLGAGTLVFVTLGPGVLPKRTTDDAVSTWQERVVESWSIADHIEEVIVSSDSPLVGKSRQEAGLIANYHVHVVAARELGKTLYAPRADMRFESGQRLALLGRPVDIARLVEEKGLRSRKHVRRFPELRSAERVGYAEVLVSPHGDCFGKTVREVGPRRNYGVEPLVLLSNGLPYTGDLANRELQPSDTLVVHGPWANIRQMGDHDNFVLLTPLAAGDIDTSKGVKAAGCLLLAIVLASLGLSLPVSLFSGAVAMILTGVIDIDEAYKAVSWRTVFLLAGLIPLGIATQKTGAAEYIASQLQGLLGDAHPIVVLYAAAGLTTALTLFMSNVAATVVLVPMMMDLGRLTGIPPEAMALLVGICAQNSFVLPTHQVNALLMAPGGYKSADYLKAGGLMTLVFLPIAVSGVYLLWV